MRFTGWILLLLIVGAIVRIATMNHHEPMAAASTVPPIVVEDEATPASSIEAEIKGSQWEVHQPEAPPPTISDRLYQLEQADKAIYRRLDNDEYALHALQASDKEADSLLAVHEEAMTAITNRAKETTASMVNLSESLVDLSRSVAELTQHQSETQHVLSKLVADVPPQKQLLQSLSATAPAGKKQLAEALDPSGPKACCECENCTGRAGCECKCAKCECNETQGYYDVMPPSRGVITAWGADWCPSCIQWIGSDGARANGEGWFIEHKNMTTDPSPGPLPRFRVQIGNFFVDQPGYMTYQRLKQIEQAILNKARQ